MQVGQCRGAIGWVKNRPMSAITKGLAHPAMLYIEIIDEMSRSKATQLREREVNRRNELCFLLIACYEA